MLMRTALDLPDGLVDEARAAMGFASKTETVAHALREMVRRNRLEELKAMFGTVNIDVDIPCPTEETSAPHRALGGGADRGQRFGVGDLPIAALAAERNALVWSLDADFERMARLKPVQLYG
jgi:predicted nucleic acid-binding protein